MSLHYSILCLALLSLAMFGKAEKEDVIKKDSDNDTKSDDDKCFYSPLQLIVCFLYLPEQLAQIRFFQEFKLVFVGFLGFTIAVICIIHNLLLFYTFLSSSLLRKRKLTYLTCLSLCDIVVGVSYLGIMCVQVS